MNNYVLRDNKSQKTIAMAVRIVVNFKVMTGKRHMNSCWQRLYLGGGFMGIHFKNQSLSCTLTFHALFSIFKGLKSNIKL